MEGKVVRPADRLGVALRGRGRTGSPFTEPGKTVEAGLGDIPVDEQRHAVGDATVQLDMQR